MSSQEPDVPDGAGLSFVGGLYTYHTRHALAWTWSGNVTTDARLSFNDLQTHLEYSRNIWPGDFLPLTVAAGAESNQGVDIANALASVKLEFLLPFNVNMSPSGEDYIVNTGPLLQVKSEAGWKVVENSGSTEATAQPEQFGRFGYDLRWTVPLAKLTVLRAHHAGVWILDDWGGEAQYHRLWDLAVETKIGNLTYFVGYQEGEAAPLYAAVNTTKAGLAVRFK